MKEVHERTHPGAKLGKPAIKKRKVGSAEIEAAELLAALHDEDTDDVERIGAASSFDEEPSAE